MKKFIFKLLCKMGFHNMGYRDARTGMFCYLQPLHYNGEMKCWDCGKYFKEK